MDILEIKNALLIGFFLAFMIGPVFFMLIHTSIVKGARAAIVFDIGVVLADVIFILIAYYGSKDLLEKIKDDPRLLIAGGVILLVYGVFTFLDKKPTKQVGNLSEKTNYLKLFLQGFFINFINIGVLAYWLGVIVIIGPRLEMNPKLIFQFFGTIIIGYFVTDIVKILLAKQLRSKLTPNKIHLIKKSMGAIIGLIGVVLIIKGCL